MNSTTAARSAECAGEPSPSAPARTASEKSGLTANTARRIENDADSAERGSSFCAISRQIFFPGAVQTGRVARFSGSAEIARSHPVATPCDDQSTDSVSSTVTQHIVLQLAAIVFDRVLLTRNDHGA